MNDHQIAGMFDRTLPNIVANSRLREPQIEAYRAVQKHFAQSNEPTLLQIPVGCGKTGLMSILPFGICQKRVLIVAPNVTIRESIFNSVDSGSKACFWRQMGVAPLTIEGPFAAKIDGPDANLADCANSHFVVTNVQQLSHAKSRWLGQLPPDFFDMILIDEGHHNAAASWRRLMDHFAGAKVVSMTATPFRSDRKRVIGTPIYRYPFLRAMARGYIKSLRAYHVAPCELSFTFRDESTCCSLEDILKLREEQWFRKGVALATQCNEHIVAASIEQCAELRNATHVKHQIIAAACSVDHAEQIAQLYRNAGLVAEPIHSGLSKAVKENVIKRLRAGSTDCIVQVQMLGEGFDHPPLSVAAIFRPFRTLSPYVQFVGRIMRVLRPNRPGHADNWGVVVSHVGLNTEQHWREFAQLDDADQQLWTGIVTGDESDTVIASGEAIGSEAEDVPTDVKVFSADMLVAWEILGEHHASEYGEQSTEVSQATFTFDEAQQTRLLPGPQQRRREARSQLQQCVNHAIGTTLRRRGLRPTGRQISYNFRFLRHLNNWAALRFWLYCELNKQLNRRPGRGKEWTLGEIEDAIAVIPQLTNNIEAKLALCFSRQDPWRKSVAS